MLFAGYLAAPPLQSDQIITINMLTDQWLSDVAKNVN